MRSTNALRSDETASESEQLPETFEQALNTGWAVVSEKTVISSDQKTRRGEIVLGLKGRLHRVLVPYTSSTEAGFQFGTPRLIQ